MSTNLYSLLARVASVAPGDPGQVLTVAVRNAAILAGAELAVLRVSDESSKFIEVRVPETASWPTARLLQLWHGEIIRRRRAVAFRAQDLRRRSPLRCGALLPVFAGNGVPGLFAVFSSNPDVVSPRQQHAMLLVVQAGVARAELERVRRHTHTVTTAEVHDRVAREIHDGPLQLLSGILVHLRLARAETDYAPATGLRTLETEVAKAIKQTRALIRNLRLTHRDASMAGRINEVLSRLERTRGLTCTVKWQVPEWVVDEATADETFQVINEALANVYRHSSAKHVDVHGRVRGEWLEVMVRDDGIGFDVARVLRNDARKLSFGLVTMQERVSQLGGSFVLRSQPGRGTRVLVAIPIRRMEPRAEKGA